MQDFWTVFNSLPQWFHFILLVLVLSVVYLAGVVLLIKKQLEDDDYYTGAMHAPAKSSRIDVDDLAEAAPSLPYAARPNFNPVTHPVYFKAMVRFADARRTKSVAFHNTACRTRNNRREKTAIFPGKSRVRRSRELCCMLKNRLGEGVV